MSVIGTQPTPYEEHRDYVLRVLGRRCGWLDASDREALLHDAYAVFLEKQRDGRLDALDLGGPQIRAYLTQTALNKAMDEGKRAGRRRSVSLDDEDLRIDPVDPGQAPDDLLASRFDDARVREVVAELPERQQLVIKLRFFFNRTPHEIQRYMGITERVYRRELERATRRLAERMELVRAGGYCDSRRSLILAYVTGVAGPNRMLEARRHLDTCPACANWAVELRTGVRRAAAFVPAPLLELPLHHAHWAGMASASHHIRQRIASLSAGVRGHATRGIVRVDASRISVVSGVRPSAVAVMVTGCLAGGSAATYCAVNGLPTPLRSLVGASTPTRHDPRPTRHLSATSPHVAVQRAPVAARRVSLEVTRPAVATRRRRSPAASKPHPASVRPSSQAVTKTSTAAPATPAQRVHESTAPEFGAGGGSPVAASSSSGNNPAPPPPSKAMPEFDP